MTTVAKPETTLADRLDTLARESAVPLQDLAERAGMNRTTLFKWRSPKHPAPKSVAVLAALADEFGVSVDWLLGRTDARDVNGQPPAPCPGCAALRAELDELRTRLGILCEKQGRETKMGGPMSMEELARQLGRRRGNAP